MQKVEFIMRRIYETEQDRKTEAFAAKCLEEVSNCKILQNKKLYAADYSILKNNKITAIGEIKVRNNDRFKYDTFFISADKIHKCKSFAREFDLQFMLFVWWNEGIYGCNLTEKKPLYLDIGGRWDRGDKQDVEPMAHFDPKDFKLVVDFSKQQ